MWYFTFITFLSFLVQVIFVTLCIAAGLYYLAELIEEYSVTAKKAIWWTNVAVIILFIFLAVFESLPWKMLILGLLAHLCYFGMIANFPYVTLGSPFLIFGLILVIVNHYLAFSYFSSEYHPFSEVVSYFTIYLWLMPFSLFVSLSANDNVLPTTTDHSDIDVVSSYISKRNKKYNLLSLFTVAKETLLPIKSKKGF